MANRYKSTPLPGGCAGPEGSRPKTTLNPRLTKTIFSRLSKANARFLDAYPGDSAERQPVHSVYGGAHLFKSDTARKLGDLALKALAEHASDAAALGAVLGFEGELARTVYARVEAKLKVEPVEDFRIDFEDGYGNRPDAEEDGHAESVAIEVAKGLSGRTLPPFIGIRIKPFSRELHARSARTLDIFLTTLLGRAGALPPNFIVTIPKVTIPEQVAAVVKILKLIESKRRLKPGSIRVELMIETPQSIFSEDGRAVLRGLVSAAQGRCRGAHFGTYDYTAGLNVTAAQQRMDHPGCDFAKHVMQVALAASSVTLSDGATNVMPVGPRETVFSAWRLHYDHVRHSLVQGYYQGWDLHPAQLVTRYAAVYAFFLEGLASAAQRLRNFVEKAAQATLVGDVFDDAATGQGLLNYFLRGLSCGALTEAEAAQAGLTREELAGRSFLKILEGRRKRG